MTRIITDEKIEGVGLAEVRRRIKSINALRPKMAQAIEAAQRSLYTDGTLPARLRELVRLRIAFHNQCRTCMAVRYAPENVPESLVCSLEHAYEAPDLSDAERAALQFADLFATDHLAIDDTIYNGLRNHFNEGELVELGFVCALFVGIGRLTATWNIVDNLPKTFSAPVGTITPWGHEDALIFSSEA